MDYNQSPLTDNRSNYRHFSEVQKKLTKKFSKLESQRFSESKHKINTIKINKNKLPIDFFYTELSQKRVSPIKLPNGCQRLNVQKKAESERLHFSPQKTSRFGFEEEFENKNFKKMVSNNKLYSRKFQTRDQPKRDFILAEALRKFTPSANTIESNLLDLFPATLDEQTSSIIVSSSKTKSLKVSPRNQIISKTRQLNIIDPEIQRSYGNKKCFDLDNSKKLGGNTLKIIPKSIIEERKVENENFNITFFNAKSTCFPPIGKFN